MTRTLEQRVPELGMLVMATVFLILTVATVRTVEDRSTMFLAGTFQFMCSGLSSCLYFSARTIRQQNQHIQELQGFIEAKDN